ncbi:MAG: DUF5615 family PIN-like protein [Anaerolineae bacterium]
MKFKIDENLPIELAELLAGAQHDAVTVEAQGLQGKNDPDIAKICLREKRILVTLASEPSRRFRKPAGWFRTNSLAKGIRTKHSSGMAASSGLVVAQVPGTSKSARHLSFPLAEGMLFEDIIAA